MTLGALSGSLLAIPLFGLLISCTVQHRADSLRGENANKSGRASTDSLLDQFGDSRLLDQLRSEQGIEKPFAWWSWEGKEKGGTVIGIDQKGMLKRVEFVGVGGGYIVRPSEYIHELNAPMRRSGDLELEKHLPDTEFPFRSFIVPADVCNVHFILVWQALNRSFDQRSKGSVFLDAIHLRLIVEKDGMIVSNRLEELLFETLDQTLAEDVNMDGRPDFLVIGSNMTTSLRIWTVGEGCAVKPLLFKEGNHFLESVWDKGLSLRKNKVNGAYDVHVTHYEPITKNGRVYFEVTETLYRWDRTELVYKVEKTNSRLESG